MSNDHFKAEFTGTYTSASGQKNTVFKASIYYQIPGEGEDNGDMKTCINKSTVKLCNIWADHYGLIIGNGKQKHGALNFALKQDYTESAGRIRRNIGCTIGGMDNAGAPFIWAKDELSKGMNLIKIPDSKAKKWTELKDIQGMKTLKKETYPLEVSFEIQQGSMEECTCKDQVKGSENASKLKWDIYDDVDSL